MIAADDASRDLLIPTAGGGRGTTASFLLVPAWRIVLLTYLSRNCTFGQMSANSSRRQPSARQQQVLDLLIRGMTNKEIGERLAISERGVKHHVSRLLVLYAVESRAELIAIVLGPKQ